MSCNVEKMTSRVQVGNKTDLERSRVLSTSDGEDLAVEFGVKFTETSPGMGHHIDELLVGIVMQMRFLLFSVFNKDSLRSIQYLSKTALCRLRENNSGSRQPQATLKVVDDISSDIMMIRAIRHQMS